MTEPAQDRGYALSSLDQMGEGYGFRKIRHAVGVTAFGINAITHRAICNVGDSDAIVVVAGGKDGYVGRDGHPADGEGSDGPPGAG